MTTCWVAIDLKFVTVKNVDGSMIENTTIDSTSTSRIV